MKTTLLKNSKEVKDFGFILTKLILRWFCNDSSAAIICNIGNSNLHLHFCSRLVNNLCYEVKPIQKSNS